MSFTHVDASGTPRIVSIEDKKITWRLAKARCQLVFPKSIARFRHEQEILLPKGAVFSTAVIAGTMAAKKTHDLIPFCHPIPLEKCKIQVEWISASTIEITAEVGATYKTGVEMEALVAVSTAALTVYDMCKSVSLGIKIIQTELIKKSGGKSDRQAELLPGVGAPLCGLVLTGGKSRRMGRDKALISYSATEKPHALYLWELLNQVCDESYLSVARSDQWQGSLLADLPSIEDRHHGFGPIGGILSAMDRHPDRAWLVLACDLKDVDAEALTYLTRHRNLKKPATAFENAEGFPEPVFAIYEPESRRVLYQALADDQLCPRKILIQRGYEGVSPGATSWLTNVNEPADLS